MYMPDTSATDQTDDHDDVGDAFRDMAVAAYLRASGRAVADLSPAEDAYLRAQADDVLARHLGTARRARLTSADAAKRKEALAALLSYLDHPPVSVAASAADGDVLDLQMSREDLAELLTAAEIGLRVREANLAAEEHPTVVQRRVRERLLREALRLGMTGHATAFFGGATLTDAAAAEVDGELRAYDDDTLWHLLAVELGERDFYDTLTDAEYDALQADPALPLPERVTWYYDKYDREFAEYGVGRLEIVTD